MPTRAEPLDRPLGTCERFYWLFGKASCTSFAVRTRLERPLGADELQRGFAAALRRHPALGSAIVADGGRIRFRPHDGEIRLPVVRLDAAADPDAERDRQLDTPFADGGCPPLRVLWRDRADAPPELLWVFDHASVDAGSAARLCLEILAAAGGGAGDADGGDGPASTMAPAPPQEARYPARFGGVLARLRWIARTVVERVAGLLRPRPPALPGARAVDEPTREIHTTELLVDRERAAALRARARDEGTTVHGAICAATLLAAAALVEGAGRRRWPIASAVDLRPRLDPPLAPDQLANVISMVATPTDVAPRDGLWDRARAVHGELRRRLDRGDAHALWAAFPPDWMLPPTEAAARRLLRMMGRNPIPLIVTNLGALEHPDAPVAELSFAMGPQPGCALVLGAVSWRGELRLCASFNRVAIGRDASERLADGLGARLRSS